MSGIHTIRFIYVNGRDITISTIKQKPRGNTIMFAALRNNTSLRNLARTSSNSRLFDDIGLNREDFVSSVDDQMRKRFWWYR
jgi:uncharacterized protein YjiS (DUF1127 family)